MQYEGPSGQRSWLLWLGLGLLLLLQALLLYDAFHVGEFKRSIPWDDCSILDLALLRLSRAMEAGSLLGLVKRAQDLAPHSPVADIQAMLGYLVSGGQSWGPYALNSAPLVAGLVAIWPRLRRRTLVVAMAVLLLLIFQPITVFSLTNLKADWKGGFFAALAVLMFGEALETRARAAWMTASALLGFSVLCKLTAFYMPVLGLMILGLFHLADVWSGGEASGASARPSIAGVARALLGRWRAILVDTALVAGPYALFFFYGAHSHFNIIKYIRHALSETWTDGLTPLARAAVYAPPANAAWGPLGVLLPVLAVASLAVAVLRRDGRFAQPLWLGVLAAGLLAGPLVFARTSNIEFSGPFVGLCLGFTLVMLVRLGSLSVWAGRAALLAAVATVAFTSFDSYRRPLTPAEDAEQAYAVGAYTGLVRQIAALEGGNDTSLTILYEDSLVPQSNLSLFYFDRTGHRLNIDRTDEIPATPADVAKFASYEYILLLAPDPGIAAPGYQPSKFLYLTGHAAEAKAYVDRLAGYEQLRSEPWKNGRLELYRRRPAVTPAAAP